MKYIMVLVIAVMLQPLSYAAPLEAKRIQPELGSSLGFQIYRFEAELGDDEVLGVRELTEAQGQTTESEYAAVGNHVHVEYEIALIDSGAFHPSLRNTYMLRFPNSDSYVEGKRLSQWGEHEGRNGRNNIFQCRR